MKMRNILILVLLLVTYLSKAQFKSSTIYKMEKRVESAGIGTYNVNVLLLESDGTYKILWQSYASRKFAKIYALLEVKCEKGNYIINRNKLMLKPENDSQEMNFQILNRRKIRAIVDEGNLKKGIIWKLVYNGRDIFNR